MGYQAKFVWSVPNGNFSNEADALEARQQFWSSDQRQQVGMLFDQYVLSSSFTWDQTLQQFTSIQVYSDNASRQAFNLAWRGIRTQIPVGWILVSEEYTEV